MSPKEIPQRRPLTLLVDGDAIERLKAHRENLSKIAEEAFRVRLEVLEGSMVAYGKPSMTSKRKPKSKSNPSSKARLKVEQWRPGRDLNPRHKLDRLVC